MLVCRVRSAYDQLSGDWERCKSTPLLSVELCSTPMDECTQPLGQLPELLTAISREQPSGLPKALCERLI